MCQMCDEYENELVRMGLIEDARKFREEREREHRKGLADARRPDDRADHGRSVAEAVAARNEVPDAVTERAELIERARKFRESLRPQTTDSLTLLREDRDRSS